MAIPLHNLRILQRGELAIEQSHNEIVLPQSPAFSKLTNYSNHLCLSDRFIFAGTPRRDKSARTPKDCQKQNNPTFSF
jgi:hypothetical protein